MAYEAVGVILTNDTLLGEMLRILRLLELRLETTMWRLWWLWLQTKIRLLQSEGLVSIKSVLLLR